MQFSVNVQQNSDVWQCDFDLDLEALSLVVRYHPCGMNEPLPLVRPLSGPTHHALESPGRYTAIRQPSGE